MAQVELTVHQARRTGLSITDNDVTSSASDTYIFPNDGRTCIAAANASGGSGNVVVVTPNTVDGLAITDLTVAVADSKQTVIGPFPKDVYNNANGIVQLTTSVVMSIIAFRV